MNTPPATLFVHFNGHNYQYSWLANGLFRICEDRKAPEAFVRFMFDAPEAVFPGISVLVLYFDGNGNQINEDMIRMPELPTSLEERRKAYAACYDQAVRPTI